MKNFNSNFWYDRRQTSIIDDFLGVDKEVKKKRDLVNLASHKRAISNFVNIVTGKSIPVTFTSGNDSYTTGDKVVIGANLNEKNFDVAVGLALHEGSHILLSDFDLLRELDSWIKATTYKLSERKGFDSFDTNRNIKDIINYIEDRRIDQYIFGTSPGYKGYYHSMYNKYFYNPVVDKALKSTEYREEIYNSYEFRLINLHNKNRDLSALNGLADIWKTIDLMNISRLKSTEEVFHLAVKVYSIILTNIPDVKKGKKSDDQKSEKSKVGGDEIKSGNSKSDGTTVDTGDKKMTPSSKDLKELTDHQKSILEKTIKKQKDFLNGKTQKTRLSKKEMKNMKSLEESGATYEDVTVGNGGKTKVLVVRTLTKSLIDTNEFCMARETNGRYYGDSDYSWKNEYDFVEEGLRLGNILGKKLKVRSEERVTKYTRKDAGKIDTRLLAELGFGNSNVFSQTFVDSYNKAYIHVSIDASGSMNGSKWNKAMTSAIALIKASDMAGNIDIVVSIRATHDSFPQIIVVYDSRKDKLSKVKSLFRYLSPTGTTPEGLTFEAIMKDLIPGTSKQDSYFVNYSDGAPMFSDNDMYYHGSVAVSHTRKQVNKIKAMGIKVLSYFISNNHDSDSRWGQNERNDFAKMYGKDSKFVNATNMMEVARTINQKFLEK
tara:strand:+ start:663 stop:2639 length:1977 start_codon:yes stop_codon:yes gene_type:complete